VDGSAAQRGFIRNSSHEAICMLQSQILHEQRHESSNRIRWGHGAPLAGIGSGRVEQREERGKRVGRKDKSCACMQAGCGECPFLFSS